MDQNLEEKIPQKELEKHCMDAGFFLSFDQIVYLKFYLEMLLHWNQSINLVGPKDWETIFNKLIIDSFHLSLLIKTLNVPDDSICWDIGSGAGLPGIPLRILWDKGHYWLIEAREKRALFLTTILARKPLLKTNVYHGRVESLVDSQLIQSPNIIISRAFMPWKELLPFVKQFLPDQGIVILLLQEKCIDKNFTDWYIKKTYSYTVKEHKRFFVVLVK